MIRSSSHEDLELNVKYTDESRKNASFEVFGIPNKDFVLLFYTSDISIPRAVLGKTEDGKNLCALVSFVPDLANTSNLDDAYRQQLQTQEYEVKLGSTANEFIFVLDRSGSM